MTQHTQLLDLPARLTAMGLNVQVAPDWDLGQCRGGDHYLWTDPENGAKAHDGRPSCYMVHHTAGTAYTLPPHDTAKAQAWIGLLRDGRLYQHGQGVPTIWLASAGPCRISSGFGWRPAAWDFAFRDRLAPAHAIDSDGSTALNRYAFNVEVIAAGDGTAIDLDVWDHTVGLGQELHTMFGWTDRTMGHTSWTKRKIDPRWSVGLPHDGEDCIIDIQNAIGHDGPVVPGPPPVDLPPSTYQFPTLRQGDGFIDGPRPEVRAAVMAEQIMLAFHGFADRQTTDGACAADGARGPGTTDQSRRFQAAEGLTVDGVCGPDTWEALNGVRRSG